ncbi:hypothetical protein, partial [Xinfangfangia pollutisoli]|uniref:hypothetical protein n=1 Tax=Xinfangfangia pollutisoli TaxID=2865960 RepID=UPI001CD66CE5
PCGEKEVSCQFCPRGPKGSGGAPMVGPCSSAPRLAPLAEPPGWRFAAASVLVLGGVAWASLDYRALTRR